MELTLQNAYGLKLTLSTTLSLYIDKGLNVLNKIS